MDLFFRQHGQGKPLVILHGLFGSSDNWQSMANRFSVDFEVITPDLRNHGQSPHDPDISYELMAGDLGRLIQSLNLPTLNLIGHSLGGKVAMQYALTYPQKVEKLVIVDIAPRHYAVGHDQYVSSLLKLNLDQYKLREDIDQTLASDIPEPVIRQFLMKNLKRNPAGGFSWKLNLISIRDNLQRLGNEITSVSSFGGPSLFMIGADSDYVSPEDYPGIRKLFPASRISVFADTGHWIHADNPERFYTEVTEFINEHHAVGNDTGTGRKG